MKRGRKISTIEGLMFSRGKTKDVFFSTKSVSAIKVYAKKFNREAIIENLIVVSPGIRKPRATNVTKVTLV